MSEDMLHDYNRMKEQIELMHEWLDFMCIPRGSYTVIGRLSKLNDYIPNLVQLIVAGRKDYESWYGKDE